LLVMLEHKPRRVMVIFPGALGDLICVLPAIAAISRRHPGASIELMARSELSRLAVGRTVVARAHSIDTREVGELFVEASSDGARRFFADFDRIYSFFASDDPRFRAQLAAATGGEVSFHQFRPAGDGHVSAPYLRAIGETDSADDWGIAPTADDLAGASRALRQSGCDSSNLVVIFPGSGSPAKNWPAEKFAALASMLAKRSSVAVILGPAEISSEPIFLARGVPVLKHLDLPTVGGIARLASAFAGNDSGVSHLAAAMGTSGVAIFGPTDPARWRPVVPGGRGQIEVLKNGPVHFVEPIDVAEALVRMPVGSKDRSP
jgi:heptosyltransferase III